MDSIDQAGATPQILPETNFLDRHHAAVSFISSNKMADDDTASRGEPADLLQAEYEKRSLKSEVSVEEAEEEPPEFESND